MHSDPRLAGRSVNGNRALVEKLAVAIGTAIKKEYGSVAEARKELKKLLADDNDERAFTVIAGGMD